MMTLAPLGAIAYLCTSQEILHRVKEGRAPASEISAFVFSAATHPSNERSQVRAAHLVTPGTRKSNGTVSNPARSRNGTRNEPRQQSTCKPSRCRIARSESAEMSVRVTESPSPERVCVCVSALLREVCRRSTSVDS